MSWIVSVIVAGLMTIGLNEPITFSSAPPQPLQSNQQSAEKEFPPVSIAPSPQQERTDQTYPLSANGTVSLNNVNGAVVIEAWDKPEARVETVKTIDCDKPYQINVNINSNPGSLNIETEYQKENYGRGWDNNNRCREARVDYKLTLPRTARLDEIETVNGNITLGGLTDFIKASTVNGRINASNLRGTINLSSVNGTLTADFESFDNVREIKMGMVNGKIDLQLPSDVDATFKADTVNGAINNDFGLPVRKGEYVGRNLYGRLGSGAISVKLNSVNGTINIRRRADGRAPKAAVNLLPAKNEDSDNDDDLGDNNDEDASTIRRPKAPRAPRAPQPPRAPTSGVVMVDEINEEIADVTREQVRQAMETAKAVAKIKIDQKEIDRQIREGMKELNSEFLSQKERMSLLSEVFSSSWDGKTTFTPMSERETKTLTVSGKSVVTINAPGGTVSIRGWERAEVSYSIARRAQSAEDSTKAAIAFDKKGSDVNLSVSKDIGNYRLEIYVPRECDLRVTATGQIRVENVKGELKLDGGDESIDVRDAAGSLSVRANPNSNVRVIGFNGEASLDGGNISLEGDFSGLETSTSGSTILTVSEKTAALLEATTEVVVFDGVTPKSKKVGEDNLTVWQLGESATTANYKMQSLADEKILIRSLDRIRVTRNQLIFDPGSKIRI